MLIRPAILCGGAGTRLWPLSKKGNPKQMLALVSGRSMLADTAARLAQLPNVGDCLIIVSQDYAPAALVEAAIGGLANAGALVEPCGKNTAPAAIMAALQALKDANGKGEDDCLLLLTPSDAYVGKPEAFCAAAEKAVPLAMAGALVTFGIVPTHAETGYGYIRRGPANEAGFSVEEFKEKPDQARAEAYLASGDYYWNAGIFMFSARAFLDLAQQLVPELCADVLAAWTNAGQVGPLIGPDKALWDKIAPISIDYAIAEQAANVAVVPVDMGWSDVGSYTALADVMAKDGQGNAQKGDVAIINGANNLVFAQSRFVGVIGVDDLIVVETQDAVLVLPKAQAQNVKDVVDYLKAHGRSELL